MTSDDLADQDRHYCKECDDEVPATWEKKILVCDECDWVIYK